MSLPTNHSEAAELAQGSVDHSNLARCYMDARASITALRKYAEHDVECDTRLDDFDQLLGDKPGHICDCGLADLLAQLDKEGLK